MCWLGDFGKGRGGGEMCGVELCPEVDYGEDLSG